MSTNSQNEETCTVWDAFCRGGEITVRYAGKTYSLSLSDIEDRFVKSSSCSSIQVVDELPENPESNTLYLVRE